MPRDRSHFRLASGELAKVQYTHQAAQSSQPIQERREGLLERAAGGLLSLVGQVGANKFKQGTEEAYIAGVRAASAGQKVEELESNPLIRPFMRGGYNDQTYRAALVEAQREVEAFIASEGRELASDSVEWNTYINQKFDAVYQQYGRNLSGEQRRALTDLGLRAEEHARERQAKEHGVYIFERTAASIGALANQTQLRLTELGRGNYSVPDEAADLILQIETTELPAGQQRDLLLLLANNLGENMHPELAQELLQHDLIRMAPLDVQTKAAKVVDAAYQKTELRDSLQDMELYAKMLAGAEVGSIGAEEVRAFHNDVTGRRSHITASQLQRLWQLVLKQPAQNDLANYGRMWVTGYAGVEEATRTATERKDIQKGANYQYALLKTEDPARAVEVTMDVAAQNGVYPVDFVGDVARGIQVFLESDAVSPAQAQVLTPFINRAKALFEDGEEGRLGTLLSQFDESTQAIISNAIRSKSSDTESALRIARDNVNALAEVNSNPILAARASKLPALIEKEMGAPWRLTQALGFRQNRVHRDNAEFASIAMPEVYRRARLKLASMSDEEAVQTAIAEVEANTMVIKNKSGLTTVPLAFTESGVSPFMQAVQSYAQDAEVRKMVTPDNLGPAIAKVYPGAKGTTQRFAYDGQALRLYEYGPNKEVITNGIEVDAQSVYSAIEAASADDNVRAYELGVAPQLMHPHDIRYVTGQPLEQPTLERDLEPFATALDITNKATQQVRSVVGAAIANNLTQDVEDTQYKHEKLYGVKESSPVSGEDILREIRAWEQTGAVPQSVTASLVLAAELDARNPAHRKQARREFIERSNMDVPALPATTPFETYDGSQPAGARSTIKVTVPGTNRVGLPSEAVVAWRHHIMRHEGFRSKDYKDADGRSVGFGHFLGKGTEARNVVWSVEQATEQLLKDTDKALDEASKMAADMGLQDSVGAKLLLASMVYQMGSSRTRNFEQSLLRLENFDVIRYDEFLRELQNSNWHKQTPERLADVAGYVQSLFYED